MALQDLWQRRGIAARHASALRPALLDGAAWTLAIPLAAWIRLEFDLSGGIEHDRLLLALCVVAVAAQLLAGSLLSLYRARFDTGSLDELLRVGATAFVVTAVVALPLLLSTAELGLPRSIPFIAAPIALLLMAAGRCLARVQHERARRRTCQGTRVLIYGAGLAGSTVARALASDARSNYAPVGFVDDDPAQRGDVHGGLRVLGDGRSLAQVAAETDATSVIVAITEADAALLRRIADLATAASLRVLVMPPLEEVIEGRHRLTDLRDISIEDIVGRQPVETDVASVAGYLTGRRVLVTGAGGSIGSELCRQIARFSPAELIMLDRDETALQAVELDIYGHGLLDTDDVVLADIRDRGALRELMQRRRPQVVFHAAALKHLPMLEQYPDEAWKTNVLGTRNVLEAAFAADVETFVNISTDKAANPTSVLGRSKQHAERLTAAFSVRGRGRYLSVRFGNVLGSRGSMLPVFTRLIEAGGPLTVTHPDVTRYFMTIPEACQLVVQAGAIGRPGEVLILDMGEPVRIQDIAERMIRMSGRRIDIVYTGLRPHEKLHEELIGVGEQDERPFHDKITHACVEPLEPATLSKATWDAWWPDARASHVAARIRPAQDSSPTATTNAAGASFVPTIARLRPAETLVSRTDPPGLFEDLPEAAR